MRMSGIMKGGIWLPILPALAIMAISKPVFSDDAKCNQGGWSGKLLSIYKKPGERNYKNDIGWTPVELVLCEVPGGKRYVLVTHKAISLGYLQQTPLELSRERLNFHYAKTHAYRGEEGVLEEFHSDPNVEVVVAATDSEGTIKVYRRQTSRIYGETLVKTP